MATTGATTCASPSSATRESRPNAAEAPRGPVPRPPPPARAAGVPRSQRDAGDPGPGGGGAAVPAGRRRLAPVAVLVNDDVVDALPMVVVHVL